jgi:DNA (cytosine-5)-methyltransferase 1
MGYSRAGFEVVGVDIKLQPRYPFEFWQGDALFYLHDHLPFDAIHASPPCQAYSPLTARWARQHKHPDLVGPVRELLQETGLPYVIENVEGAPLLEPAKLCGSFFGLDVRRHRLFETNWPLMSTPCSHHWQKPRFRSLDLRQKDLACVVGVHGHLNYPGERVLREEAMGIDWMTPAELVESIPPAYTEFVGEQLMAHVRVKSLSGVDNRG